MPHTTQWIVSSKQITPCLGTNSGSKRFRMLIIIDRMLKLLGYLMTCRKKNSIQNNLTHSLSWLIVKEPCDAVSPVSTFLLSWGFTSKFGLFSCLLKKLTFQSFIFNFCRHRRRRHGWWKLRYLSAFWYCWLYISSTKRKTLLYTMVYLYLVFPHKRPLEKPLNFFRF